MFGLWKFGARIKEIYEKELDMLYVWEEITFEI